MNIWPREHSAREMYKLLIGAIIPRPIAWVTSLCDDGSVNLAPFSFFNGVCSNPPTVSVSFSWNPGSDDHTKDTLYNIRAREELVIHIVDDHHAREMNLSSADFPRNVSEMEWLGLQQEAPATGSTPRIAGAPIAFECSFSREVPVGEGPGSATLVLAQIQHIHVADDLIDDGLRINPVALGPVGRLAGSAYCRLGEVFSLDRPKYRDLL